MPVKESVIDFLEKLGYSHDDPMCDEVYNIYVYFNDLGIDLSYELCYDIIVDNQYWKYKFMGEL